MEPKLPSPNRGPEQSSPAFSQGIEHASLAHLPEKRLERKTDQREASSEADSRSILPPVLPSVQPVASDKADDASITAPIATDDSNPLVAADDDLIEKEWVDKAKEIIAKTRDDPYQREREVGKLQADYLRKRYGKELGAS